MSVRLRSAAARMVSFKSAHLKGLAMGFGTQGERERYSQLIEVALRGSVEDVEAQEQLLKLLRLLIADDEGIDHKFATWLKDNYED